LTWGLPAYIPPPPAVRSGPPCYFMPSAFWASVRQFPRGGGLGEPGPHSQVSS